MQISTSFRYGYCNGNTKDAVREYQRRFPTRRKPHGNVFSKVKMQNSTFPKASAEHPVEQELAQEEVILNIIEDRPSKSVSNRVGVSRTKVLRPDYNTIQRATFSIAHRARKSLQAERGHFEYLPLITYVLIICFVNRLFGNQLQLHIQGA